MDCSSKIQLPPELLSELANAFRFDLRWSVLRVSSSIFDHFLAKRQQKILQNVDLKLQQALNSHGQHVELDNFGQHLANFQNKMSLPMSNVPIHEAVLAARVLISVHTGNFNELYAFLEGQKFPRQIHPKLQKIWWDVHFLEAEQTLGASPLTPIQKYKVREKHPLPATIWEKNGVFKENEMILINEYFTRTQYIAVSQKLLLALVTGLSMTLIASWFKNLRLKQKKAQRMKMLSHAKMPSAELEEKDEDDLFDEMPPFTNLFLLN
ncbi:hypothetical protein niasHT_029582 [Heterodera trifolii]|uniref:Homeobox domain-containing protein n=1 Tax=Heterodera trifolii TaxID=157864 RepID=A0ABD2JBF8_9BILA